MSCDLGELEPKEHTGPAVGIDVGLTHFATLSSGEHIANPRFFRTDEQQLARAQRRLSAQPKGSAERAYHKRIVRRIHERIANRRKDFAHKLSRRLVAEFGTIVFEDLRIARMIRNHSLAKSIADAAWNQLVSYTQYKAEGAGAVCIQIDPRGTSQRCMRLCDRGAEGIVRARASMSCVWVEHRPRSQCRDKYLGSGATLPGACS